LYEFQQAVFNKLWQQSPKAFFKHLELLEDKYKLISMPFSFRFSLHTYNPSRPTTPAWFPPETSKSLSLPLKDSAHFSTLLTLQWKVIAPTQPGKNWTVWTCLPRVSNTCATADAATGR
jgi:hypothetical protein